MPAARPSGVRGPERRKTARRHTFLGGRITVDKLESFDAGCAVRNVSAGGARLGLNDPMLVPSTFRLGIAGAAGQRARLVWYRGGEMGVAFGESSDVEPADVEPADVKPAGAGCGDTLQTAPLQIRMQAIIARRSPSRSATSGNVEHRARC